MTKCVVIKPIEEHVALCKDVWRLSFFSREISSNAFPGQFVHICIPDRSQPFLRRPLSIADVNKDTGRIDLIYRVVGDGTRRLSALKVGEMIDCMGPLGTGFKIRGKKPLLVGGGMGIAPLIFLSKTLKTIPLQILLGAKDKSEMFWADYFFAENATINLSTEDGSVGTKGYVTELLPSILAGGRFDEIYTCGPEPLMEIVAQKAKEHNIPCQVSLEKHMGCGVGACLSCTCEISDGSRRKICTDGPVFNALEVFK